MACTSKKTVRIKYHNPEVYVFLAHVYATDTTIDERIPRYRKANHHVWLGGDICLNTTNSKRIFKYLDHIFDLKSPHTHWAIGNHDLYQETAPIEAFTKKKVDYATYINGITLIVINSNTSRSGIDCSVKEKQTDFINGVLDTVQVSSHVILMSHHVFWGDMNEDSLPVNVYANTNHSDRLFYCEPAMTAKAALYPQLVKVSARGVKVILLAGDLGQKRSAYEYTNSNNITFLGSGGLSNTLYNTEKFDKANSDDSILVFTHYPDQNALFWRFVNAGN